LRKQTAVYQFSAVTRSHHDSLSKIDCQHGALPLIVVAE